MNLTRREFGRIAGAGIAAQLASPLRAQGPTGQNGTGKVGYCIVGLGRISMGEFMPGVLQSPNSHITALVSGHRDKALRVAAQYGVPTSSIYSYEEYDKIRDNPAIDAVYIALPNSMHAEYTIRAAKAGKHVLSEKPMATSVEDCKKMIQACRDANKKLMIAYRCQYEATNLRAVQLIREGKLGKVQSIEAAFGFNIGHNEWRTNRKLSGGGPMVDVGIYCLNATRYLTGEEPTDLRGYSSVIDHDGRFNDVEESLSWSMKFPSGILANCETTYGAGMNGFFRVYGSDGNINVDPAFNYNGLRLRAQYGGFRNGARIDEPNTSRGPYQFTNEANHFSDCVLNNKTPKTPGEEGLRDMALITRLYSTCGEHLGTT